ncbi:hypothetical protein K3495_g2137 [Podosphaera aphanis]|nr:hypothetical protein K3495_g2137 [Podosphaera aphanis]
MSHLIRRKAVSTGSIPSIRFLSTTAPRGPGPHPTLPSNFVQITEVGARDGLQSEPAAIPVATKLELIQKLAGTGLSRIEAGSFVSPKWVPQVYR